MPLVKKNKNWIFDLVCNIKVRAWLPIYSKAPTKEKIKRLGGKGDKEKFAGFVWI